MAASPGSAAATSDIEPASSPNTVHFKSFMGREDYDDVIQIDDDTRLDDETQLDEETRLDDNTQLDDDTILGSNDKPSKSRSKGGAAKDPTGLQAFGKIRHLKKDDGEPLWRVDIQYDLLRAIFDNDQEVFTNSYEPTGKKQCFADLYIDTMSRSSKTSKVLRDKLLSDREAAKGMAMVCLLVNVNRMNTTLNFFPEMRAQLRTYHAIPSLQANQDPHAYKQLQDAPRLKSILKGGAEDRDEPGTLEKIKDLDVPRTNPVNLIFVMCSAAHKIAELHFPEHLEFHDLIMKTHYSSPSRAAAFLWLMWFYLESDFTEEGCDENPFGPGVDYELDVANQGVPELDRLTEGEQAEENIDTECELEFGHAKQKTRAKILEMDNAYLHERENKRGKVRPPITEEGPAILPRIRPSKNDSDIDSTRSTPPPRALGRAAPGVGSTRRGASLKYQIFEGSSPAPQGPESVTARKPRPPTAHQLAVERGRTQRVEYILDKGLRRIHHQSRKLRKREGAIFRAYRRMQAQEDPFEDSEGEAPHSFDKDKIGVFREKGLGGLYLLASEPDDFGEEVSTYAAALRRSARRLDRWNNMSGEGNVVAMIKKQKPPTADNVEDLDGADESSHKGAVRSSKMDAEDLDPTQIDMGMDTEMAADMDDAINKEDGMEFGEDGAEPASRVKVHKTNGHVSPDEADTGKSFAGGFSDESDHGDLPDNEASSGDAMSEDE